LKGKPFLGKVTDNNSYDGNGHVGRGRPEAQAIDQKFQSEIVDQDVDCKNHGIAEKLLTHNHFGMGKGNVPLEEESCAKDDRNFDGHGSDVGT